MGINPDCLLRVSLFTFLSLSRELQLEKIGLYFLEESERNAQLNE